MNNPFFNEENIQNLFGHEAAEDENFERLQQYYFKNKIFRRITADLPLRILVGHKGIGKSALFQIAMSEDADKGVLPILVKPDDIIDIQTKPMDFLQNIRCWRNGLSKIIIKKALITFGYNCTTDSNFNHNIVSSLNEFITVSSRINVNSKQKAFLDGFLETNKIAVYIDDLDRGWVSGRDDVNRISTLLNAVRDIIKENQGVHFRIALRSDVYFLVRTSDESTDKIEGSVVWYDWTNHEILVMLIKRIETFFGRDIDENDILSKKQQEISVCLHQVMESHFSGKGHWNNAPIYRILMSLIRKRPRDLVKLCTLAARKAYESNSSLIRTQHFEEVFEQYSQGRIQDTINEYRSELPQIERLIMGMKPNRVERKARLGWCYTTDALLTKINNIIKQGELFKYANGKIADARSLANFMYKTNFLTARKILENGEVQRKYFEENRYISGHFVDFGYDWEIHPAYRWALQPDKIGDIFEQLNLSADD
ncbi:P-loop ATPase, Sll1717 family [Sporomusa paucivorans]|uniref:P-loop ATPase, Sll1717 family n=1 Tax=Sporomusa paucivorans TaxID=2376 RepID=UPI003570E34E